MDPYRPRAFALTLAKTAAPLPAPHSRPLALPFNAAVTKGPLGSPLAPNNGGTGGDASALTPPLLGVGGAFDGHGNGLPADLLPATLVSDGVTFQLGPTSEGSKNAVVCRGQKLSLPPGLGRSVYLLAAAVGGDTPAIFLVGGAPVRRTIQSWDGYVGQWDNRTWQGKVPELTYDWHNKLGGLTPGYIKPAPVAWYADHKRLAGGGNDPYRFCYLFRVTLPVPDGAKTLTLPQNAAVRVLAASVSQDPNADTTPAQPLYDRLDHAGPDLKPFYASFVPVAEPKPVAKENPVFQAAPVQTFGGTGDGSKTANVAGLPLGASDPWTINQFVYLDKPLDELTLIGGFGSGADDSGTQRYLIKFHDGIHFWGSNVDVTTGLPFDLGKWQMVTLTYDGKTLTIYKNAQSLKTDVISLNDADNVVKIAAPGPWGNGGRFAGKVAGFAIWNRALSQPEVQAQTHEYAKRIGLAVFSECRSHLGHGGSRGPTLNLFKILEK